MATYFGDIAKAAKDLISGGFSYDNKHAMDIKSVCDTGVKFSGAVMSKGGVAEPTGSLKTSFDISKALSVESETSVPGLKVTAVLTHAGAVPGFKASLSGDPAEPSSAKLAMQILRAGVGLKCDLTEMVGYDASPKADASVCYSTGDAAFGASAVVDLKSGALGKYSLAAQVKADEHTVALVLADSMDTVKGSWVMAVDKSTSAGVEAVYKLKKGDLSASAAVAHKITGKCSAKIAVASPLPLNGAKMNPVLQLQTSGTVAACTTGTFSVQTDATLKCKYGVQFATKV
eukprot:CAMPEP_0197577888 /NCGR_PEP_ID=MMETSP1326-20131121/2340_1 /TAXON_ID=1155430 /ORGANISM="Genus nov. species nov., Strain RCC2288" /LENGTH=287 /DNA_ID=CAMNT_0043141011 /DNA_START=43 /DNA_END=906 /DNA_ORIENTATION=+